MDYKSGLSDPVSHIPLTDPSVDIWKSVTAQDCVLVFGSMGSEVSLQVDDGSGWTDVDSRFYLARNKWVYPAILVEGSNTFRFRSRDFSGNGI